MVASDDNASPEPRRVVGVHYEHGAAAPSVVVKGAGAQVDAVLAQARSNADQRVVHNPDLVRQLYRVPIDGPVASSLFPVMATLLIHVLEKDRREMP
jgi:type III secretion system FlhB-like substrate exporter